MYIPQEIKIQAVKELPLDCRGQSKCSKMVFYKIECECECYKQNLARLMQEFKTGHKRTSAA